MALDYAGLTQQIINLSPTQIGTATAQAAVNTAYQALLRGRPGGGTWFGLQKSTTLSTVTDKAGGTIALTFGSQTVTGTGTAFASADIGRYLVVGARQPLRISDVSDATHLTLQQAWSEDSIASTVYALVTLRYSLPSDADRVLRLVGVTWPVVRRNLALIDAYDPIRAARGEPLVFCETELLLAQSSTITGASITSGTQAVTGGASTVTVTFSSVGTSGYQVFVTPSWNTSYDIESGRTATSFTVDFGVPAPVGGSIDWQVVVPGTPSASSLATGLEIELWPVPNQQMTMMLQYRKRVDDLANDSDAPVLAAELVLQAAKAEACQSLANRTGEQSWIAQAQVYTANMNRILDAVVREDRRLRGSHPVVMDVDDAVPVWDQAWIATMRQLNTLSLPGLAF